VSEWPGGIKKSWRLDEDGSGPRLSNSLQGHFTCLPAISSNPLRRPPTWVAGFSLGELICSLCAETPNSSEVYCSEQPTTNTPLGCKRTFRLMVNRPS
jgi:hypothetical protein